MAFDTTKAASRAARSVSSEGSFAMAASSMGKDPEKAKEEMAKELADLVNDFLDNLTIIHWFISDSWAADLIAALVEVFGRYFLNWLNEA